MSRRPWTTLSALMTAAHHGFELASGVGLVAQPELGLPGAIGLWSLQIPTWVLIGCRGGQKWDKVRAAFSGAALGASALHFVIWPWRPSAIGLPVLVEAEGLGPKQLPIYTGLLYVWGVASVASLIYEVPPEDRKWALAGLATLPVLLVSARHHFRWIKEQARSNPQWWNRGVEQGLATEEDPCAA